LFVRDTIILCFNSADLARSAKMKKCYYSVLNVLAFAFPSLAPFRAAPT
jgi:hypothetical protein